uniref:non-specific serine/threonine protein kinase n=1 Tax=Timema poppense TaxID=170557 RepID=A0A7R9H4A7_TIMPO|nr:unnamed protein product [Timema poppensis]
MSMRVIVHRLLQNGRVLLRSFKPYQNSRNVVDEAKFNLLPRGGKIDSSLATQTPGVSAVRNVGFNLHYHARRLFVDNVLRRVTNSLSADLRRRAAKRILFGDSAPFFTLVGVSLASGTGLLTKDDELEGICWEIREAVAKLQWNVLNKKETDVFPVEPPVGLDYLTLGPAIAKGCNAVVYAAQRNKGNAQEGKTAEQTPNETQDITMNTKQELSDFPFAVKMMFNYDAESNAASILRAMYRETVPARSYFVNEELSELENRMMERKQKLPQHPNIVEMHCAFADRVPDLPGSFTLYPDALPPRINPDGSGRNMSLFLVMKRYDCSLKQYLKEKGASPRTATLLLSQLLEGVAHMNMHGVVHRDLKSDNILLDLSEGDDTCPLLVVTDFGCCLADKVHGLYMPYHSPDTDRGGNTALMAPEVVCAEPGSFTSIDYSKSDAWAVGALAYEIFGTDNPFYANAGHAKPLLRNVTYSENDLPHLPLSVPTIAANVVAALLSRNLSKRLSAEMAATVIQLSLWAPSSWLQPGSDIPATNEILQWLLCLTTKVLCEGRKLPLDSSTAEINSDAITGDFTKVGRVGGRRTLPEYQLISTFLCRVTKSITPQRIPALSDIGLKRGLRFVSRRLCRAAITEKKKSDMRKLAALNQPHSANS